MSVFQSPDDRGALIQILESVYRFSLGSVAGGEGRGQRRGGGGRAAVPMSPPHVTIVSPNVQLLDTAIGVHVQDTTRMKPQ